MIVPFIPETAPFTVEQRAWLNGFFAGLFSRHPATAGQVADLAALSSTEATLTPLTILFGSQTGTAEALAKRAAKEAGQRGLAATVLDMSETDLTRLAAGQNVLVIVSTFGDGEPPDSAKTLHSTLAATASGPLLANLRFSVCALGDTNYTQFCQCGKDFDAHLEKLGAVRIAPRADCDLDHEEKFAAWLDSAFAALRRDTVGVASRRDDPVKEPQNEPAPTGESAFSRQNPFPALLLTSRNLNAPGSSKQVHHIEFSLERSGLTYEAGDALGVVPQNCPELVADVLAALHYDGEEAVPAPGGGSASLRRALTEHYDLGKPPPELLEIAGAALRRDSTLRSQDRPAPTLVAPAVHPHVIDVLRGAPDAKISPTDFVRVLRKLQPRLYSIASSPKAHPGQVHLTVGAVRYHLDGQTRKGVCSTFLADRVTPGATQAGVFVHSNKTFRPPSPSDTPMIMVGPGTGIAPFRAFLQERRATGAKGRNWLFFGDQRAATDFLYREELLALRAEGTLTRLDTAFSRDQAEKIYVQHRMLEHAAELYAWLEAGAHFYVCGDASHMAKDVDSALQAVIERAGAKTREQASDYVQALKAAKRYARDVY